MELHRRKPERKLRRKLSQEHDDKKCGGFIANSIYSGDFLRPAFDPSHPEKCSMAMAMASTSPRLGGVRMSIDLSRWLCCCSRWSGWGGRGANGDVCAAVAIFFALASPPQGGQHGTTIMTWKRNDPSERSEFCKRRALQQNRKRKA